MKGIGQNQLVTIENVSRETLVQARNLYSEGFDQFESYLNELMWWNTKVNLVSRDVSRETIREHIIHSLLVSVMGLLNGIEYWIDAGTGGGLPGIPLAIKEREKQWLLNDVISKKVAAVKQIVHKLNLTNASGRAESIETLNIDPGTGVITKHAFSADKLITLTEHKPWKRIIMLKGADEASEEIRDINPEFRYSIYRFDFSDEPFYTGKGVLVVENSGKSK